MDSPALSFAMGSLPLKAVRVEILDADQKPVVVENGAAVASGFLMSEDSGTYLYTCWHVVTGINPHAPTIPGVTAIPRRFLRISLRDHQVSRPGLLIAMGGLCEQVVPLYSDATASLPSPLWEQDPDSREGADLSLMGLAGPAWHDAIRIRLPDAFRVAYQQKLHPSDLFTGIPHVGDNLQIVGYPYGFSAIRAHLTPIVLTRTVAAVVADGARHQEILIDGACAPGMSGSPAFLTFGDRIYLFGVYTGCLFPDGPRESPDRTAALGTVCSLGLLPQLGFSPCRST